MIDYIDGILLEMSYTNSNNSSNCFNSFVFPSGFRMPYKMIVGKFKKQKGKKRRKKPKEINS